jgi:hypothetical protein
MRRRLPSWAVGVTKARLGASLSVFIQIKEKTGKRLTQVEAASELGRRGADNRRIGTRGGCATENCKNTMQYIDGHCKACHYLLPKKLKAETCISIDVGGRVCRRELFRGNQCRKCYDCPEEKKMRDEKKAARPKCTINGCKYTESRAYNTDCAVSIIRKAWKTLRQEHSLLPRHG